MRRAACATSVATSICARPTRASLPTEPHPDPGRKLAAPDGIHAPILPAPNTTTIVQPEQVVAPAGSFARQLMRAQRLRADGTATMMVGTLIAGTATYAWQAAGTRTLGKVAFAPVANTWTLYFLIVTLL